MTTPYEILPLWIGETVCVLGAGPSLTPELAVATREHHCIAVNRAVTLAPWADMLVSIDGNWPEEASDYAGLRIVGNESEIEGLHVKLPYEIVTLTDGTVVHIRSNALAAIRIAAAIGATRILLYGFDTELYEQIHNYRGLTEGLAALIAELGAQNIIVERIAPQTRMKDVLTDKINNEGAPE